MGSHIAFKHGKYAEVSSQSSSSAFKNVATTLLSQAELNHSTDAPDKIQPTSVVSIPLPETTMSDSPSTSATVDSTCKAQAPPETIEITDNQPKIKQRRIRHDVLFKAEVLQKKDDGMTTADLLVMCKSFNLDKTKVSKWSKHKENIIKAASDIHKKKLFKICPSVKYQSLYKELYAQFTKARSKGYHVDFNWLWSKGRSCNFEKACDCQLLEMQQLKTKKNSTEQETSEKAVLTL